MIWLALRLLLEVALSCHCLTWSTTPHGARCIAPLDHAKCELVSGWHPAAFGVAVCSRNCNEPVSFLGPADIEGQQGLER